MVWVPVHSAEKKRKTAVVVSGQDVTELRSGDPEWKYPSGQCEKSGWYFKASGYDSDFVDKFMKKMDEKKNPEEAAARKEAKKEAAEEMKDMLDMEED